MQVKNISGFLPRLDALLANELNADQNTYTINNTVTRESKANPQDWSIVSHATYTPTIIGKMMLLRFLLNELCNHWKVANPNNGSGMKIKNHCPKSIFCVPANWFTEYFRIKKENRDVSKKTVMFRPINELDTWLIYTYSTTGVVGSE